MNNKNQATKMVQTARKKKHDEKIYNCFGIEVKAGQIVKVDPKEEFAALVYITQVALGEIKKGKPTEPVVLYLQVSDQKLVLGTLIKDTIPHIALNVVLDKEAELSHNSNHASVYFTGYKRIREDQIVDPETKIVDSETKIVDPSKKKDESNDELDSDFSAEDEVMAINSASSSVSIKEVALAVASKARIQIGKPKLLKQMNVENAFYADGMKAGRWAIHPVLHHVSKYGPYTSEMRSLPFIQVYDYQHTKLAYEEAWGRAKEAALEEALKIAPKSYKITASSSNAFFDDNIDPNAMVCHPGFIQYVAANAPFSEEMRQRPFIKAEEFFAAMVKYDLEWKVYQEASLSKLLKSLDNQYKAGRYKAKKAYRASRREKRRNPSKDPLRAIVDSFEDYEPEFEFFEAPPNKPYDRLNALPELVGEVAAGGDIKEDDAAMVGAGGDEGGDV